MIELGIDRILAETQWQRQLSAKRIAIAAHPASVTRQLQHSIDAIKQHTSLNVTSAFGPQHGMRGEKQDNMVESKNYLDPIHAIPVFSLYGDVRRPTEEMMQHFDVLLFDIQDLGCRIYTYITTLLYLLEACAQHQKSLYVLDRPNPAGRPIEGNLLEDGWQSFVGAGAIIMRHGLTVGEMAQWFVKHLKIDVELHIVKMKDYDPTQAPGYGWPVGQLSWVNPSPNASSLNMARCYSGTVLLEGTTLSEGRGTTIALEIAGAPDVDFNAVYDYMHKLAPQWLNGVRIRPCFFEPTFHKHAGTLCHGLQWHTDTYQYKHLQFKPFRVVVLMLKALRTLHPQYDIWRDFAYEYELNRLAFDVINGGTFIRDWIDDSQAMVNDLETRLTNDEKIWRKSIADCLLYRS